MSFHMSSMSVNDLSLHDCPLMSPPGMVTASRCSVSHLTAPGQWWHLHARSVDETTSQSGLHDPPQQTEDWASQHVCMWMLMYSSRVRLFCQVVGTNTQTVSCHIYIYFVSVFYVITPLPTFPIHISSADPFFPLPLTTKILSPTSSPTLCRKKAKQS